MAHHTLDAQVDVIITKSARAILHGEEDPQVQLQMGFVTGL